MSAWPTFDYQYSDADKKKFALELIRHAGDAYKAALATFGGSKDKQAVTLWATSNWTFDTVVVEEQNRIYQDKKLVATLRPNVDQMILSAWHMSQDLKHDVKSRIISLELAAKLSGFITNKPEVQVNLNNKVMIAPDYGSDDEWEHKVKEQQKKLTGSAH